MNSTDQITKAADLKPLFDVGDSVWVASCKTETVQVECPECLGSGLWSVTTPAGEQFECACQNCLKGYGTQGPGTVPKWTWTGLATLMTVGSVRTDTHDQDRPIEYMMNETGVGTGTIHPEANVSKLREPALAAGERKAVKAQEESETRNSEQDKRRREEQIRHQWWPKRLEQAAKRVCEAPADMQRVDVLRHILDQGAKT